jgi:hypothetical protein
MVRITDKSWLNPKEDEIGKRWNTFLTNKSAASQQPEPEVSETRIQISEGREDPGETREVFDQRMAEESRKEEPEERRKEMREVEELLMEAEGSKVKELLTEAEIREEEPEFTRDLLKQIMAMASSSSDVDVPVDAPPDDKEEYKESMEERGGIDQDKTSSVVNMFSLFEQRNWAALIQHLKLNPSCALTPLRCGAKGLSTATKGNLLLHEACRIDPPLEFIEALLKANKDALSSKGEKGYLPLHYACACSSAEVVARLLEENPDASKIRNESDLMLPLHIACKWGFSTGVIDVLLKSYPEGSRVRDIYAMVPKDYASKLSSDSMRQEAVARLTSIVKSKQLAGRITLIEQSGKTFSEVREDLNSANVKLERMTAEFDHRERSFALMFGREQDKVLTLEEEKNRLQKVSTGVKSMAEQQAKKLDLLEREHKMMTALQRTNTEKRALLQKKVSVLENAHGVKKDIIGRLEREINVKCKQELEFALQFKEEEFQSALSEEKRINKKLQKEIGDAKLNHELYTKALLQEHDNEIAIFEEVTRKFEVLERELREQIEYEGVMRNSVEMDLCDKEATFKAELKAEQERVIYLEGHVERMNELLESEQERFNELEELLKVAIQTEDEEQAEVSAAIDRKRMKYEKVLKEELTKVKGLEIAYTDVQTQLKKELEKIEEFEKRESALLRTFETEQKKLEALEVAKNEIQEQLDAERGRVAVLKTENKHTAYETEKQKLQEAQASQNEMQQLIDALYSKLSKMEDAPQIADGKMEAMQVECDELKHLLEKEKTKGEGLGLAEKKLSNLLEAEVEKVKNLEEAARTMITTGVITTPEDRDFNISLSPCPSEEKTERHVVDLEKKIAFERSRIWNLHTEQAAMKAQRDALEKKVKTLEENLGQKENALNDEKEKFDTMEQLHSNTLELLAAEREVVMTLREEQESKETILEKGNLEKTADDLQFANNKIQELISSVNEKTLLLYAEQDKVFESHRLVQEQKKVSELEQKRIEGLQKDVKSKVILLDFEKDRVRDLEKEISRLTSDLMYEKRQVTNLNDNNNRMEGELSNTQKRANSLEQENTEKQELLENEKRKIMSLESARDQLQELLQLERSKGADASEVCNLMEKLTKLGTDLSKTSTDLEEKEIKVHGLSEQLQHFEMMKSEIVRLSAESRRRDMMLGAVLQAISGDSSTLTKVNMKDMKQFVGLGAEFDGDSMPPSNPMREASATEESV